MQYLHVCIYRYKACSLFTLAPVAEVRVALVTLIAFACVTGDVKTSVVPEACSAGAVAAVARVGA